MTDNDTDAELAAAGHANECMCECRGEFGIIEYVYRGRGERRGHIRAKVILDTRVLHVDFDELRVW